ncbi:hypothetical protein HN011_001661, partial [Eciton burchellii]
TLWKKARYLHGSITLATTAEDRKKLFYFLQDEFLTAEDVYNEAADHLQEAMINFVKAENSAYDGGSDTLIM